MKNHRFCRSILSAFLFLSILIGMSAPALAYTYDPDAAISYANLYAIHPNIEGYRTFSTDCTNFVSQCLFEGGIPEDDVWFYFNGWIAGVGYSEAWATADSLKNYLKNNLGAKKLVSKWTKTGYGNSYAYINNSSNLTGNGEIMFYDWTDDGIIDHAAICVGTGYPLEGARVYGDLIDQHTTNRKQVIWHLDVFNTHKNTTAIYAFGL